MGDANLHAKCSPSGAERWMTCTGSVAMEAGEPEQDSEYSKEGTRAHTLAAQYFNEEPVVMDDDFPPEMHDYVLGYVHDIRDRVEAYALAGAVQVDLHVEQKLPLERVTGEKDAKGTADAVIIARFDDHSVIEVNDLKYGMGVHVSPTENPQLMIYALAAIDKFAEQHVFRHAVMRIHQPRVAEKPLEWECGIDVLEDFRQEAMLLAGQALSMLVKNSPPLHLVPSEKACRFCKAAYKCPAIVEDVHKAVYGDFQVLDDPAAQPITPEMHTGSRAEYANLLPLFMERVDLVESWCKAIRAKVEQRLMGGEPVAGWKLVQGRRGHRQWADDKAVRGVLTAAEIPAHRFLTQPELVSPAALEKEIGGKRKPAAERAAWEKVSVLVKQNPGKPSVAPESDERPVYSPQVSQDFQSFDGSDLA